MEDILQMMATYQKQQTTLLRELASVKKPALKTRDLMSPYREGEDIQSFLSNFERVMRDEEVEREDWAKHLFKLLEGSARQAVDDSREEQDYNEIAEMLRRFFNVTDESNRKSF